MIHSSLSSKVVLAKLHRVVGSTLSSSSSCSQRRRSITSSSLTITPHSNTSLSTLASHRPHPTLLKFGQSFSPHMLLIPYENKCWKSPSIVPYGDLQISPAASALHYGMECFEGMKAYRTLPSSSSIVEGIKQQDNVDLRLFRPEQNMERLRNSMKRLGMPGTNFDSNEIIHCIKQLVRLGKLYMRMYVFLSYIPSLSPCDNGKRLNSSLSHHLLLS